MPREPRNGRVQSGLSQSIARLEQKQVTLAPPEGGLEPPPGASMRHEAEAPAGVQLHSARQRLPGALSAQHPGLLRRVSSPAPRRLVENFL